MQVKVFESKDMASGLKMVRRELGPDALILSTRTVKNGKLGLLGKQVLEITAAIDSPLPEKKEPEIKDKSTPLFAHQAYQKNTVLPKGHNNPQEHVADIFATQTNQQTDDIGIEQENVQEDNSLRHEVDELKNLVKDLAGNISQIKTGPSTTFTTPSPKTPISLEEKLQFSKSSNHIENLLNGLGVDKETAQTLSSFAKDRLNEAELHDSQSLSAFLRNTVADLLTVKAPDFSSNERQRRIAMLGPTGVGKTTTLAKIAARYLSNYSNSIALITIDTYRIAAVEQLKVYGEIMHLPVEVVITPEQLEETLDKHQDKELILIDTAGRSPRDLLCIEELQSFFHPDLQIENHLVLSATTRENELLQTIQQFDKIGFDSIIFTKTDECSSLGVLLNIQVQSSSPLSYITNGQRVPEDIAEAEKQQIAQLIIPFPYGSIHDE